MIRTLEMLNEEVTARAYDLSRARNRFIDEHLQSAILSIEGVMPPNEEIARRAHRVIYADGKVEWTWDGTVILRQKPTAFHPNGKFAIQFDVFSPIKPNE